MPPNTAEATPASSLEDRASVWSRLSFWWVFPLLSLQFKASDELPELPRRDQPGYLHGRLQLVGSQCRAAASTSGHDDHGLWEPFHLLTTLLFRIQRPVWFYSFLSGWTFLLCMLLDPIMLGGLLHTAAQVEKEYDVHKVYQMALLVLGLALCMLFRVANMETCFFASTRVMNNARSAIVHAVFRHSMYTATNGGGGTPSPTAADSMRLKEEGGGICEKDDEDQRQTDDADDENKERELKEPESDTAAIAATASLTNLMSTDADKLGKMPWIIFSFSQWSWALVSLPVVVYFVYQVIGVVATSAGLAIMFLGQFTMRRLAGWTTETVRKLQEARDLRSNLITEYVKCVRLVKLQSLTATWFRRLSRARAEELRHLKKMRYLNAFNVFVGSVFNFLLPTVIFTTFVLMGNRLTGVVVFTTLAWIQQLNWSLQALPGFFNAWAELSPSLTRLADFLNSGDRSSLVGAEDEDFDWGEDENYDVFVEQSEQGAVDTGAGSSNDRNALGQAQASNSASSSGSDLVVNAEAVVFNSEEGRSPTARSAALTTTNLDSPDSTGGSNTSTRTPKAAGDPGAPDERHHVGSRCEEPASTSDGGRDGGEDKTPDNIMTPNLDLSISPDPRGKKRARHRSFTEEITKDIVDGVSAEQQPPVRRIYSGNEEQNVQKSNSGDLLMSWYDKVEKSQNVSPDKTSSRASSDVAGPAGFGADMRNRANGGNAGANGNVVKGGMFMLRTGRMRRSTDPTASSAIRDNILFHSPLDEDRYFDTLQRCCLLPDLEMFPDYDNTLVGESGVQLSGGQKARVGLARALYSDADILFLDDVLSAVDAHTGRFLFDNVLCACSGAQDKTVVLITHQLQYLEREEVSQIFLVDGGTVKRTSYGELAEVGLPEFLKQAADSATSPDKVARGGSPSLSATSPGPSSNALQKSGSATKMHKSASTDYLKRVAERELLENAMSHTVFLSECTEQLQEILQTMEGHVVSDRVIARVTSLLLGSEDETRFSGSIPFRDLGVYLSAFGSGLQNFLLLVLLVLSALSSVAANVFLTYWANQQHAETASSTRSTSAMFGSGGEIYFDQGMTNPFQQDQQQQEASGGVEDGAVASGGMFFPASPVAAVALNGKDGHAAALSHAHLQSGTSEQPSWSQSHYLLIYVLINLAGSLIAATQTIALTFCSLKASVFMHEKMLTSLLNAPLSFFDITPTGRILNRFLQDMQNIDNYVPTVITQQVQNTLTMLTQLILIFVYCPLVLLLFPVLVIPYTYIFKRIRAPARDTRRIESIAHSPVYSEFVDCLKGLDTIRAMGKQESFCESNLEKISLMSKGKYWNEAVCKWAQSLTTMWGCVIYFFVGVCGCWFFYEAGSASRSGATSSATAGSRVEDGSTISSASRPGAGAADSPPFFSFWQWLAGAVAGAARPDEDNNSSSATTTSTFYLRTTATATPTGSSRFLSSADFGLVLLYAGVLQRAMMDYCMGLTTLEQNFVSVERCCEYCRLPGERKHDAPGDPVLDRTVSRARSRTRSKDETGTVTVSALPLPVVAPEVVLDPIAKGIRSHSRELANSKESLLPRDHGEDAGGASPLGHADAGGVSSSSSSAAYDNDSTGASSPLLGTRTPSAAQQPLLPPAVALEVNHLSLRYRLHKNPVLEDVSFQIQKGEKVAIIGRSGSGKSSLFNALSGLYPAQPGSQVLIGGCELSKTDPELWRRSLFRMVSQDSNLISGSVRENLLDANSARPDADPAAGGEAEGDTTIWRALELVGLKERIRSFPTQLDHQMDAAGENFSVGERQLFAVARALIDEPELIFCDEATANIDLMSDERIHEIILNKLGGDTTVLWIMHRLHFVMQFDKVLIFEQGKLVECGYIASCLDQKKGLNITNFCKIGYYKEKTREGAKLKPFFQLGESFAQTFAVDNKKAASKIDERDQCPYEEFNFSKAGIKFL
eukprot:g10504.t1